MWRRRTLAMVWRFEANERGALERNLQDFCSCIGSKTEPEGLLAKCQKRHAT